jgi:ankyrin repeat protein
MLSAPTYSTRMLQLSIEQLTALKSVTAALSQMRVLLEHGADPCKQAALDGTSTLHAAVAAGRKDKVKLLVTASSGRVLHLRDSNGVRTVTLKLLRNHYMC